MKILILDANLKAIIHEEPPIMLETYSETEFRNSTDQLMIKFKSASHE